MAIFKFFLVKNIHEKEETEHGNSSCTRFLSLCTPLTHLILDTEWPNEERDGEWEGGIHEEKPNTNKPDAYGILIQKLENQASAILICLCNLV